MYALLPYSSLAISRSDFHCLPQTWRSRIIIIEQISFARKRSSMAAFSQVVPLVFLLLVAVFITEVDLQVGI